MKTRKHHFTNSKIKPQVGGVKVGYGGFGCVVTPPILCSDKPLKKISKQSAKFVSKILPYKFTTIDKKMLAIEKDIYRQLEKLDPSQNYFIYASDSCNITPETEFSKLNRRDIQLVKFAESPYTKHRYDYNYYTDEDSGRKIKINEKNPICYIDTRLNPYNIIFPHAGPDFFEITVVRRYNKYRQYFKANYKAIFYKILSGIALMHHNDIVHADLKLENYTSILPRKKSPNTYAYDHSFVKIIDFGLSFQVNKHYRNKIYYNEGSNIPVDMFIASYVKNYEYKELYVKIREIKEENHFVGDLWNINEGTILRDTITEISKYIHNGKYEELYTKPITGIIYVADIYSAGISFVYYIKRFSIKLEHELTDLLYNMLDINPFKRYNINDCILHPFFEDIPAEYKIDLSTLKYHESD